MLLFPYFLFVCWLHRYTFDVGMCTLFQRSAAVFPFHTTNQAFQPFCCVIHFPLFALGPVVSFMPFHSFSFLPNWLIFVLKLLHILLAAFSATLSMEAYFCYSIYFYTITVEFLMSAWLVFLTSELPCVQLLPGLMGFTQAMWNYKEFIALHCLGVQFF